MLSDKPSHDYSRIDVVLQDVSGLGNFRTVYRNVINTGHLEASSLKSGET